MYYLCDMKLRIFYKRGKETYGDYRERYVRRLWLTHRAALLLGVMLAALATVLRWLGLL